MSTISAKGKRVIQLKLIGYWATTILVAFELLLGGVTDLVHGGTGLVSGPPVTQILTLEGYPLYLLTILGVWKIPGGLALLVPRFPRLKEWAYAGAFFVYIGAVASGIVHIGDLGAVMGPLNWITPLTYAALTLASWALRPPSRTLGIVLVRRP